MPELVVEPLDLATRHAFGLSRGSEQVFSNLLVRIRHQGLEGHGEVAPSAYYGETAATARAALDAYWPMARERVAGLLEQAHPLEFLEALHVAWEARLHRNTAARSGLDAALWDLWGKSRGTSAGAELRGPVALNCPSTSYTIAIDSPDTLEARLSAAAPYAALKVKLGGPDDLLTLRRVRNATDKPVRVDANCAWRGDEAVRRLKPLIELGVEMIEQPCPPRDLKGLAAVRSEFDIPVYADESAETLEDLEALEGCCDGINVKLVKAGGPTRALRYIRRARELGLEVMLGCMIESSLGITAAAHLGPLVNRLDLDGALLLVDDPYQGVEWQAGVPVLPAGPGLGVRARS